MPGKYFSYTSEHIDTYILWFSTRVSKVLFRPEFVKKKKNLGISKNKNAYLPTLLICPEELMLREKDFTNMAAVWPTSAMPSCELSKLSKE